MDLVYLRLESYALRQQVNALRRLAGETSTAESQEVGLADLERQLAELERSEAAAVAEAGAGDIGATGRSADSAQVRGPSGSNLQATVELHLDCIPTGVYHLLDPAQRPLVACRLENRSAKTRRVRLTSFVDGYSAKAVSTIELAAGAKGQLTQLPTLFPARIAKVREQTSATVNVMVEDLDDGRIELHQTRSLPMLARNTVSLWVRNPTTGEQLDLSAQLGAYVTPNAPAVQAYLRKVADEMDQRSLAGYLVAPNDRGAVEAQVAAIFRALRRSGVDYVNSLIAFSPEDGGTQRVRLPRESLRNRSANCIDGTLLVASLLEAASLNPAIVIVPGHAFVGWEVWQGSDQWRYLETTMIGSRSTFAEAVASAESKAARYSAMAAEQANPLLFRRWPLAELRARHNILPME